MAPPRLARGKKGAQRSGRIIAFLDETGHTFRARLGTTWAPCGETPILTRVSRRREISSVVLLTAPLAGRAAELHARHFAGTIHAAELITSLRYFRRILGAPLWLVWDRLNVHRSPRVQAFLARHAEDFACTALPSYAPELNPEEQCNQWVKHDMLHALPASIDELLATVRGRLRRLQHYPDRLANFFAHAGPRVN
ncbi:MAG: transposase [Chloroflexota bacterium]|nr:transposase [Chloroflexota bacterium]